MDKYVILDIIDNKVSLLKIINNKVEESLEYSYDSSINKKLLDTFINNLPVITYDETGVYDTIILRNIIKEELPNLDSYELNDVSSYLEFKGDRIGLIYKLFKYTLIKKYIKNNINVNISMIQRKFLVGKMMATKILKES